MLFYSDTPGATTTTNATPNTENDCFFIKPGATRTVWFIGIKPTGRGFSLTSISGTSLRCKKWTSTASSGGTAIVPTPKDPGYQAATHTSAFSSSTVVSGTGGPLLLDSFGIGSTTGPIWLAPNFDWGYSMPAAATQSIDLFNVSGAASQILEYSVDAGE